MDLNPPQQANHLRKRLRWWLVIVAAVALVGGVALWTREMNSHAIVPAIAVLVLLALGILVDQVMLSAPIRFHEKTTRDALLELNQRLVIEAHTDALTGLYNRRGLESFFRELVSTRRFRHQSIAMLMIDLDDFKRCNDQYGHLVGDQVLQHVAGLLRKTLRRSDGISRWGGDEFCVILPDTALSQSVLVAKKFCSSLANHPLALPQMEPIRQISVKASIGVVAADIAEDFDLDALIAAADKALYQAKTAGGNTAVGVRLD